MRKRTQAREFALQALYQIDITKDKCDNALDNFWQSQEGTEIDPEIKDFSLGLARGVCLHLEDIDKSIMRYATNWQLERMAFVDRNILRLASFEILFCDDIPPKVSINEAVELAKKYSGSEASKFVNGILDKIKSEKAK